MVYVFLADGFEEVEAIAPIDILRRGNVNVTTVSLTKKNIVRGVHNICIETDTLMEKLDIREVPEMLVLPGGMPGTQNLKEDKRLETLLKMTYAAGGYIAAICAAPSIIGELGMLEGREATCYPGFEESLHGARVTEKRVVKDGNIITAIGMGAAIEFGVELVKTLRSGELAETIKTAIRYESVRRVF